MPALDLEHLTEPQRQAVEHVDGPLLILAGPGSGKTRVVTHRIAYLLSQGVWPSQIVALTFTNKAADEMRLRLHAQAGVKNVWLGTFHSFCARLLRRYAPQVGLQENFSIYDTADSERLLKLTLADLGADAATYTPERLTHAISWAKHNLITPAQYEPSPHSPLGGVALKVYAEYQRRLLAANAVDFDDLLLHVAVMLRENPELRAQLDDRYRYILVDEYQDTNLAQYAIVRALSIDHPNLAVTGDPDQSIYGWRGANLSNILDFERDFPSVKVVRLEQNWRSTQRILRVADTMIRHNRRRKPKALFTDNPEGAPVRLTSYPTNIDEAHEIAWRIADDIKTGRRRPRDFAIFYRTNALSRTFEEELRLAGVPYQIVSGLAFYQRKEVKDLVAFLKVLNNPHDDVALLRIINEPPRGIGKTTVARLREHALRQRLPLLAACREAGLIEPLPKRAAVSVAKFVALLDRLSLLLGRPVEEVLGQVLAETGYREVLMASEAPEDQDRLANVEELLTAAREFDEKHPEATSPVEQFLEQAALVNDTDTLDDARDRVALMTLHAAKGLEFPVVFIVAIEQGLLPHQRSKDNADDLEEERRLFFVGLTRAEEELHLSLAGYRSFRGVRHPTVPSMFTLELPRDEIEWVDLSGRRGYVSAAERDPLRDEAAQAESAWREADEDWSSPGARREGPRAAPPLPASLQTAAAMFESAAETSKPADDAPRLAPDAFTHGMTVVHREYGPGKIVALSGGGSKRTATINFATVGQKRFVLAHAPLRPA